MDIGSETCIRFGCLMVLKPHKHHILLTVQREMKMHLKFQRKFYVKTKFSN